MCLQHLNLFLEPLLVLQITVVPLPEYHESKEDCVIRYMMVLRVLIVFVQQGLHVFEYSKQVLLV